ncbi:MAG: hypothetical protein VX733_03880 [Candidatus Latescibacterota bacterium]|nr:hypothetical protein [Candidatus Latescibacterota bacterium]
MLSIAQDVQGSEVVLPWLERAGVTFPSMVDQHNQSGKLFSLKYVPVAIILDEEGRLVRPVANVNIGNDEFRADLEAWVRTSDIPAAWRETPVQVQRDLTADEAEADVRFQLACMLLWRNKKKEALDQLEEAVALDPENWLIRKQKWAIEAPEAFYDGPVDDDWQADQRECEDELLQKSKGRWGSG